MKQRQASILATILLAAAPLVARAQDEPVKPVTKDDVTAVDVVTTPATDLNVRKDDIPRVLLAAQANAYDTAGIGGCSSLAAAIAELDEVLGEDLDLPQDPRGGGPSVGRIAQSVVGSILPFRGIVREISGANEQQRRVRAAIVAGSARRGFLKGMGLQRGCRYPARPATDEVLIERAAAAEKARAAEGAIRPAEAPSPAPAPPPPATGTPAP